MSRIKSVLSAVAWPDSYVERLRDGLDAEQFVHTRDPEEIGRALEHAEVAVISGNVDDRFLAAPNLRWVHCALPGLDGSATPSLFEKGLLVTSSSGRTAPALAEHCLF